LSHDTDASLLVGIDTSDDAAVWRLDDDRALVFTADFFTPIVDDPAAWGRIAAANALSDVYAMGGKPLLCLNLVAWPRDALPLDTLGEVLAGGATKVREAGALVVGGHSIDDAEPKYGMAVIGLADPRRVVTNAAAAAGDRLLLTKPIGSGVIATAIKNDVASAQSIDAAVATMEELNAAGAEAMLAAGARAATDVTGFGLLGHLQKMLLASGVSAEVFAGEVPLLPGAEDLARAGQIPGGSRRNREHLNEWVTWDENVPEVLRVLLTDAQTSGGLLIAASPTILPSMLEEMSERRVTVVDIGAVTTGRAGTIAVVTR
jgi:selenide, water dikinase